MEAEVELMLDMSMDLRVFMRDNKRRDLLCVSKSI